MIFVERYIFLRDGLREVVQKVRADYPEKTLRVGIESPIFNDLYSEGMYDSFYTLTKLMLEKCDTVYLNTQPSQSSCRFFLKQTERMEDAERDMVDAVKQATEGGAQKVEPSPSRCLLGWTHSGAVLATD